jgi:hypothetical protein
MSEKTHIPLQLLTWRMNENENGPALWRRQVLFHRRSPGILVYALPKLWTALVLWDSTTKLFFDKVAFVSERNIRPGCLSEASGPQVLIWILSASFIYHWDSTWEGKHGCAVFSAREHSLRSEGWSSRFTRVGPGVPMPSPHLIHSKINPNW